MLINLFSSQRIKLLSESLLSLKPTQCKTPWETTLSISFTILWELSTAERETAQGEIKNSALNVRFDE